jgi:hypothetical protein
MDIFFNSEKKTYLDVIIYFCEYKISDKENNFFFFNNENDVNDIVKGKIKKIIAKFIIPSYMELNAIKKESIITKPDGTFFIHENAYEQNIIKSLLVKIIMPDYEIEVNEDNYGKLHPTLVEKLFIGFERKFLRPEVSVDEIL